uniref:DUF3097 domain-containing protein n=1 Tax=uncultured bacterium A1Q1_fos_515 TaxID=1256581 RepID=L7VW93_9BACT|nr:hypothetical protein [uncultured bacterium A1Q1_fos_515]
MRDILEEFEHARRAPRYPSVPVVLGMVVEDRASGFCGDVVKITIEAVTLRDRRGAHRHFRFHDGGFLLDGRAVTLVRTPASALPDGPRRTNSGSVAAPRTRARVARASRIWVEGRHDAELVEHVWGDDLRDLGIAVEPMHGIDDLVTAVAEFVPGPQRRLGILVDHLVDGSKEQRLASRVRHEDVLVTGHPFVDVWAAVRPHLVGLDAWPEVPRDQPWKEGICAALGADPATFWPRLRGRVRTYADLRPELVGAVERLIDFVAPS